MLQTLDPSNHVDVCMKRRVKVSDNKEMAQPEKIPTLKTEVGKPNTQSGTNTNRTHRKPSEQLFLNSLPLSYPYLTKYNYENIHKLLTAQQFNIES